MSRLFTLCRLAATGFALAVLSGCATAPGPAARTPTLAAAQPVPGIDLAAKFKVPDRERGRRDRARMNAQFHLEMEADEKGPPTAAQIFRAREQREAVLRSSSLAPRPKGAGMQPSQWQPLGPSNVGGRVRSMAFDPRNANRLLAGTASGGLWISADAGASWRANSDFFPNLSVSTIAFDPVSPNVVYLGTGEASAGLVGVGVFKSLDGGETWRFLPSTNADANPDWRFVNRVAVNPGEPNVLLAGVTSSDFQAGAIYRSTDGGASWTRVFRTRALDLAFDPNDPASAVAGLDDGTLAYSRDGGLTWAQTLPLVPTPSGRGNTARAEIAFARSQPGAVFASVDNARGEVWRSLDSGATWTRMATPGHLGNQGDYDNAVWVDPTDAAHIVVGGLDLYQSRDGGLTFARVSDWRNTPASPHADHHVLVSPPDFGPGRRRLFNGNDGGVYRADNVDLIVDGASGAGWTNVNNGLAVTQFYSGAGRTAAGGRVIGGTQDNGSLQLEANLWRPFRGGDGGYVAVDPLSDRIFYGSYVYLSIHRTLTGGFASYICNGITEALPNEEGATYCGANNVRKANFIAPFILDPNDRNRLLAGANSLWVSDDARAAAPAWRTIKAPSLATDNFINAVAVHEGNGNVIWVGHNNGEVYRSFDGLAASPTWSRMGAGVLPARRVQR
ncbi:MAG TPA: hypothetical protein VFX50_07600, partial [Gemmatimonadales bacterium]|nr:hypothetical protein [Gemmatimonadales bacterium]